MSEGLAPPPPDPSRLRAASTNVRPALTLCTLGRRRSVSPLGDSPPSVTPVAAATPTDPDQQVSSMLVIFVSRLLEILRVQPTHAYSWSPPIMSSARSSTDDVLPTSASTRTTFGDDVFSEKRSIKSPSWHIIPSVRLLHPFVPLVSHTDFFFAKVHVPILCVILLFPLSTALVLFCLYTLPISLSSWPRTLTDLAQLGRELHGYSQSGPGPMAHVVGVMSITAVWKHAWSIPGSVIWVSSFFLLP
jgi:hypothetical protein